MNLRYLIQIIQTRKTRFELYPTPIRIPERPNVIFECNSTVFIAFQNAITTTTKK